MVIAFFVGITSAWFGWRRAAKRGGSQVDRWQYAAAHGIPAFLVSMILATIAARMGWLGG